MTTAITRYILSIPERMERVRILVLPEDFDKTLRILHGLNAIHVIELKEEVIEEELKKKIQKVELLQRVLSNLLSFIDKPITILVKEVIDPSSLDELFDSLTNKLEALNNDIIRLKEKANSLKRNLDESLEILKFISVLSLAKPNIKLNSLIHKGKTIQALVTVIPEDKVDNLRKELENKGAIVNVLCTLQDKVLIQIVFTRKEEKVVQTIIEDYRCKALNIPALDMTISEYKGKVEQEIDSLSKQYDSIISEIKEKVNKHVNDIAFAKVLLENELEKVRAFKSFLKAKYVNGIEGWIPVSIKSRLINILNDKVKRYLVNFSKPDVKEEPPTKTNNPRGIRNFEVLTKTYGIPKYNEWDPTPLIAYSFPIFFGLMLGDAIYGLFLIIATKFVLDKLVEDPESEGFRRLKNILYISGITSTIVGFLSGSFMGQVVDVSGGFGSLLYPILNPYFKILYTTSPLLNGIYNMLSNPLNFIILAMIIGLIHVNIALILSLIRSIKHHDLGGIMQNIGLLLIQIFGIPLLLMSLFNYRIPVLQGLQNALIGGVIVSLGLIVLSQLLIYRALGVLTWIFAITGLLGDVLSYTRIAGVGMATVYLANGYTFLSTMVYNGLASLIGVPVVSVIIAGIFFLVIYAFTQLLNLALSTLGAFIHSLRLCFVEFLTKFYEGGGIEYNPIRIVIRRRVILKPSF